MSSNATGKDLSKQVKALTNHQRDALVAVLTLKQHELLTLVMEHHDNPGAVQAFGAVLQSVNALSGMAVAESVSKRGHKAKVSDPAVVAVTDTFQQMLAEHAEAVNPEAAAKNAELEAEMERLIESGVAPAEALSRIIRQVPEAAQAQAHVEAHRGSDGLDGLYL